MKFILCILVAFLGNPINAEKFSFDNYKLVRLNPIKEAHIDLLNQLENNNEFDIWNGAKSLNKTVDVSLSPSVFKQYKRIFERANLPYQIVVEDLQNLINEQEKSMSQSSRSNNIVGKYARYSQIQSFLENMEQANSDLVSSYSIGTTYEQRDLKVLVIKTPSSRKSIWIDCGIHAREYVSVAACVYFIDRLIKDYRDNEPSAVALLNNYEFHVLPLVNPDGYEYTFTSYRLWRKNRQPSPYTSCVGTDVNRNFAYQWMVTGASSSPCSDIYAGSGPASEIETQSIQNALDAKKGDWEIFMTLHSYGGFWMPPYAYTSVLPPDYPELAELSKVAVDAIRNVHGENFIIGTPYQTLNYAAAGGSYDWAKAINGIKYAYALELRPSRNTADSRYGFMLPEDRAILAGEETYAGLIALFKEIQSKN